MSEVPEKLCPTYSSKTLVAMKAPCAFNHIAFELFEASPSEMLHIRVPKLNENEVPVPGSLVLRFDIDPSGGHTNNFLVQNVMRALVDKMVMKFVGTTLDDTNGYDTFKIFEDLFLSQEQHDNMLLEGIQSEDLYKIHSGMGGDKGTSGVDAENALYGSRYHIRLEHAILSDHGVFYPQALYNDLLFEGILVPVLQLFKGSDPTKLKHKLTNIQLEYEMIRSMLLVAEGMRVYSSRKEFLYDHVMPDKVVTFNKTDMQLNMKVTLQRRSLKAILLLFVEPYPAGTRDSEKFIFLNLTKLSFTINSSLNMLYNEGIISTDLWAEAHRFFVKEKTKLST